VATVFVDFHKNKLNFLHKHRLQILYFGAFYRDNRHYHAELHIYKIKLLQIIFWLWPEFWEFQWLWHTVCTKHFTLGHLQPCYMLTELIFLEWLYLFKSEVSRYLWTPQGQKLGCPYTVDTNGLTPMEECTQSWAWVHFAKSNPTQSTSWLTQSNPIHNGIGIVEFNVPLDTL